MLDGVIVLNNPVNKIDPTGQIAIADDIVIGAVVLTAITYTYLHSPQGQAAMHQMADDVSNLLNNWSASENRLPTGSLPIDKTP